MMLYRLLKRMIERSNTEGLAEKLKVFSDAGKISKKEYRELTKMLKSEATA